VADLTIPDGSPFLAETAFTKTWRIKNAGSCTWTKAYDLVFSTGTAMTANVTVPLAGDVKPGATVDLSVKLTAPAKAGTYTGAWLLRNAADKKFGAGTKADQPVDVVILVLAKNEQVKYNFLLNVCAATWKNGASAVLPCLTGGPSANGFTTLLAQPHLEGRVENEPVIWVYPNNVFEGQVDGVYPVYTIKNGDHFRGWIGCLDQSEGCNVIFRLGVYNKNGDYTRLGSWNEVYDGKITSIDIDLSSMAGQNVQFVLRVIANNSVPKKANAFWLFPRIERVSP